MRTRTPFVRLALWTTGLTYALILVGGLVRASGAGLGCPDWPRCFGSWIPPASVEALPPEFDPIQFNPTLMWTEHSTGCSASPSACSSWRRRSRRGGTTGVIPTFSFRFSRPCS